jgi:hypothetical protein
VQPRVFGVMAILSFTVMAAVPVEKRAGVPAGKGAAVDDRTLEASIRGRFAKSKINEDKFTVRVQGGVATIEGRTEVLQHKGVATRLAKAAGARQVVNRVEPSEAARQKASSNLASGRRRAQVKRGEPRSERKS